MNERPHLWTANAWAVSGWLQVMAFIWLAFTLLVMRLRWVVSVRDSAIPFLLELGQFVLIATIEPG